MIVGMHQTNLLPYEGILSRIRSCDRFVLLDQVQFTRGNYHNRFQLDGRWFTMAVNQKLEPLYRKRYTNPHKDWAKIKRQLPEHTAELALFDEDIHESLVLSNTKILRRLLELLEIQTEIVVDYPTAFTSTERLINLCKHYGATTYLSGPSGAKYMNEIMFKDAGIRVEFQQPTVQRRAAIELLKER